MRINTNGLGRIAARAIFGIVCGAAGAVLAAGVGQVGSMAADWSGLKGLDGKTYNLKDYKGKALLIMSVQWDCGGCNADAPKIGAIAMKYQGKAFQAFGVDIAKGTANQLGTFDKNLIKNAPNVNFPLLMGLPDSAIVSTNMGTKWSAYDALRDVFFVVDYTGKIVARIDGNRGNYMGAADSTAIAQGIAAAVANVPTSIGSVSAGHGFSLQAYKRAGIFQISLDRGKLSGDVSLQILDSQGRLIRNLAWSGASASGTATWDGMDKAGKNVPWGAYFLNAATGGTTASLLLSWVP